jgi:Ca2+-binding RTX toxin-like protein
LGGDDTLVGGAGGDYLDGAKGDDTLCATDGAAGDRLFGGPGADRYVADAGDELHAVETRLQSCPVS